MVRSLFNLARPMALVVAVVVGCLLALHLVETRYVRRAGNGRPMNYAGSSPPCPRCEFAYTTNTNRTNYRCDRCGRDFVCYLGEGNKLIYDPPRTPTP
jgi:hypothetical protein